MHFSKEPLGSGPKGNAGFTLIELAIVLVVIGLIIAAVLKGEDLINNGRMLNFVSNPVREAQTAAMAYYDRTGQYPDAVTNGNSTTGPLYNMYQAGITSVLDMNTYFNQGGVQLGAALGNIQVTGTDGVTTATYPVMVIEQVTKGANGLTVVPWSQSALGYANYLKSKIDGNSSSWTSGRVRMLNSSVPVEFKTLASELTNAPSTVAYDGFVEPSSTYSSSNFVTPAAGQSYTLVYFYDQQPH